MKKQIMIFFSVLLVLFTVLPSVQFEAAEVEEVTSETPATSEESEETLEVPTTSEEVEETLGAPGTSEESEESLEVPAISEESEEPLEATATSEEPEVTPEPSKLEVLEDGSYTIDFQALHEVEDKASSMARYIDTPAALSVKNGKNFIKFTLTNNEQITAFQVEQDEEFIDATVVSTNEESNTRVIEFEVADLTKIINAKVTVFVAAANHTGNYAIRLAFDKESVQEGEVEETPGKGEETPGEIPVPEKQEYELSFDILQVENDGNSATADYVKKPAKIVVEDGKTYVYLTLLHSDWWKSLKIQTKQPGTFEENNFVDAEVISEDQQENTRLVKFEVQDLNEVLNAKIHIIVTGIPGLGTYDHSYDIRIKFDSDKTPTTPEEETPEVPGTPAPEILKDGAYTIDYQALHEVEDKASSMARYIETPAALAVEDGKNLVTLSLTNNEQITAFQVEQDGEFIDATVVSTDEEANTRAIEFEVADLTKIINAKVTVFVAAANHTGNYKIRLAFDKESMQVVEVGEIPGGSGGTPGTNPTPEKEEYELEFAILQADNDEASVTAEYAKSPAKIVIEGGKTYAYVTLLHSDWWKSLKIQTEQPGSFSENNFVNAEVISENDKANTRLVKFEVQNLKKELKAKIHIIVTGVPGLGAYDHSYDIRIKFGESSKTPSTPGVTVITPEQLGNVAPEIIEDGAYIIDYQALHETEDKVSSMAKYIETPAALSVKNGKNLVTLILTNNEKITAFQVEQDGKFVDATVISIDEETNTRVIEFEVADFTKIINTKVVEFMAAINEKDDHTVRLVFDRESIQAVVTEEVPVEVEEVNAFSDIDGTWAKLYIESLASKQIVTGKTATTFAPNSQITRAEFVVLLVNALELPTQEFEGRFSDVTKEMDGIVYEIEAVGRAGIINVSDGKFRPNEQITRQQMVTMIIRAIEHTDASILEGVTNNVPFADAKDITGYAKTAINLATGLGIIDGKVEKGEKLFEPKANATRAHASKMIYFLLETLQK